LLVNSQISQWLQKRLRFEKVAFLKELFSCPICIGFWVALILSAFHPIQAFAMAFIGSYFYEWKQKNFPCVQCSNSINKVSVR